MERKVKLTRPEDEVFKVRIEGLTGETFEVELDVMDIDLPYRWNKAYLDINKTLEVTKGKITAIRNKHKGDKPNKNGLLTAEQLEESAAMKQMYQHNREICDNVLGNECCETVFGSRNYWTMFADLFELVNPTIKEMSEKIPDVRKKIEKKYGSNKPENSIDDNAVLK